VAVVRGHGFLEDPPARNMMWMVGFDSEPNYNAVGLNCGGFQNQWEINQGKCGICGDPFQGPHDHEAGGIYAAKDRPVTKCYSEADHVIDIAVKITAYHKGYFEFRLCENNNMTTDPTLDCFDNGHLLEIAGNPGVTRYDINDVEQLYYRFQLDMPTNVRCSQCIMRWIYNTGNSWGCDTTGCGMGMGPQEQFINCADISILPHCDEIVTNPPVSTTEGTWTDEPITDPVTTPSETLPPTTVCHSTGHYAGDPSVDEWCMTNCLHPTHPLCPETHCACD